MKSANFDSDLQLGGRPIEDRMDRRSIDGGWHYSVEVQGSYVPKSTIVAAVPAAATPVAVVAAAAMQWGLLCCSDR
jgi:hypothetical protein